MCFDIWIFTREVLVCGQNATPSFLPREYRLPIAQLHRFIADNSYVARDFSFGSGSPEVTPLPENARCRSDDEQ
jgi:hypothetical protein